MVQPAGLGIGVLVATAAYDEPCKVFQPDCSWLLFCFVFGVSVRVCVCVCVVVFFCYFMSIFQGWSETTALITAALSDGLMWNFCLLQVFGRPVHRQENAVYSSRFSGLQSLLQKQVFGIKPSRFLSMLS